ncbi:MAG: hypothetical protein K1000chlam4_00176 [Chlamydiae bacterium]|nr:hypothetical protein [Chlamydiota bacterium]
MINSATTAAITRRMHHGLIEQSRIAKVATVVSPITDLALGVSGVTLGVIAMLGVLALSSALQWCFLAAGAAYTILSLVSMVQGRYNLRTLANAHQEKQRALGDVQVELDRGDRLLERAQSELDRGDRVLERAQNELDKRDRLLFEGVREIGKLEADNQLIIRGTIRKVENLEAQIRKLNGELAVTSSDKADALAMARGLRTTNVRLATENKRLETERRVFGRAAAAAIAASKLAPETVARLVEIWDKPEPKPLFGGLLQF